MYPRRMHPRRLQSQPWPCVIDTSAPIRFLSLSLFARIRAAIRDSHDGMTANQRETHPVSSSAIPATLRHASSMIHSPVICIDLVRAYGRLQRNGISRIAHDGITANPAERTRRAVASKNTPPSSHPPHTSSLDVRFLSFTAFTAERLCARVNRHYRVDWIYLSLADNTLIYPCTPEIYFSTLIAGTAPVTSMVWLPLSSLCCFGSGVPVLNT
jgi:hypothetical protein